MALLFCLLVGCSTVDQRSSSQLSLEHNKEIVRMSHDKLWSHGNFEVISDLYADDFVCHFVIGPEWKGFEGLRAHVKSIRTGFPDWREDIQKLVAEGDYVVSYFKSSGTHLGEFRGLAPTGRRVQIDEVAIYRLRDGKIVEQWGFPDIYGMNVQLGIAEPDGRAGESQPIPSETNSTSSATGSGH